MQLFLRRFGMLPRKPPDENERLAAFMAQAQAGLQKTAAPAKKPSFDEMRQRVARLAHRELFAAFATLRLTLAENGRDVHAAAEAALIAKRLAAGSERAEMRLGAAVRAIGACLANGHGRMAIGVFAEFIDERTALKLEPAQWEALGRVHLAQGSYLEAAWALHAGALLAGNALAAQKHLVEVAGRAGAAGQPQTALKLYGTLLAKYPESEYAAFVRTSMKLEGKKLTKA